MALIPLISASVEDGTINITDVTGFYNVTTNPTGWEIPNLSRSFTGTATLTIYNSYTGSTIEEDIKAIIAAAVFPTYTLFDYTPSSLADGVYDITLTLVNTSDEENPVTYIATTEIAVYCNVICCVDKFAAKVKACGCDDSSMKDFLLAEAMLTNLSYIAKCLGREQFLKTLKKLQTLCDLGDCGCS
jgi:hypothetical protein